ncbi:MULTISPECIES: hypothetical protein [Clostridium]|uniref:hypothetical protein n=1 Tax=Clostridium TaxID=1485 RepID=UPI00257AF150|nr:MULTISPECIES: hypothetical protein [Clostridium]MBS4842905.1 hypothetical protein [Clostridium sp.]MDU1404262.1 hypothetical protein [Clostridium sp.]MDU1601813.1 hypothetical protein [Clostridium sp.]MDU2896905.1 hypothetical protein [Clostridium sp.]MDU3006007.1 hypothetical protein [Clostridium sp.]
MQIKEWMEFLADKKEHYPVSDEFIKNYQQSPRNKNGYVFFAWETGHIICREISEPNQKWHFFESYMLIMIAQGKIQPDDDAEKRYRKLNCPELLLWIAEAVGIDSEIVNEAARKARVIIDSGTNGHLRTKAGYEIREEIIPWKMIEDKIKNR